MHRGSRHDLFVRALAASALATLALAVPASAATDGDLRVVRNVTTSAGPGLLAAQEDPAVQQFWHQNYWRVRGYAPYYDDHTFNGSPAWTPPPSDFYRDLYSIYNNESGAQLIAEHPEWVLRDGAGNKLYIQYGCAGGTCPQYAADIGNPGFRSYWVDKARQDLAEGYSGIFVDDVNLGMHVSNGSGTFTRPVDPRTGSPMTDANWRRYVAEFTEEIRAAFPSEEIVHNVYWRDHSTQKTDPYVLRELAAADTIEVERGFNDPGLVGGAGAFGYETFLAHMDWLHSRGLSISYEPNGLDATSREFEVASYYLAKDLDDSIVAKFEVEPSDWSQVWETDLGNPSGPRYSWNGLFRRDFASGTVLANQPGQTAKTVSLPTGSTWTDLAGNPVTSVTLAARRGKVLFKEATPPPPPPDTTPPETTITSGPTGTIASSSASFGFSSSETGSSFSCRHDAGSWGSCTSPKGYSGLGAGSHTFEVKATDSAGNLDASPASRSFTVAAPGGEVTIKPKKPHVRRGRTIVLTGTAPEADAVEVNGRRGGHWRTFASDVPVVDGSFRVTLRARRSGGHRYQASAPGLTDSPTVRVRVKA